MSIQVNGTLYEKPQQIKNKVDRQTHFQRTDKNNASIQLKKVYQPLNLFLFQDLTINTKKIFTKIL